MGRKIPIERRFWSHVSVEDENACWLWRGSRLVVGYGKIKRDGKQALAHRVAYELAVGPIPEGLYVCHRCDNRLCCNPRHLFVGTHLENIADMCSKQRQARGDALAQKITSADVAIIRVAANRGESQGSLSRRFGVAQSHVSRILSGHVWRT